MVKIEPIVQTAAGGLENQDRGAAILCRLGQVFVVADGAGGTSGGAEAADLSIEFVRQHAEQLDAPASCVSTLQEMDLIIARNPAAGETTCALAVVGDDQVFGASVGDSGVWLISGAGFVDLTGGQSRKPLIGSRSARPFAFAGRRVPGEYLLLATDGLLKYAPSERIVSACRAHPAELDAAQLIELVRYPSGALPDDVTVILFRL